MRELLTRVVSNARNSGIEEFGTGSARTRKTQYERTAVRACPKIRFGVAAARPHAPQSASTLFSMKSFLRSTSYRITRDFVPSKYCVRGSTKQCVRSKLRGYHAQHTEHFEDPRLLWCWEYPRGSQASVVLGVFMVVAFVRSNAVAMCMT